MLNIKFIRENLDLVKQNNQNRKMEVDIDRLLELDEKRKEMIKEVEELRGQKNQKSKEKPNEEDIKKMREVGDKIRELDTRLGLIEKDYNEILKKVPNLAHPDSPVGGEEYFNILHTNRDVEPFEFEPKDHEDLMTNLDLIDFERGAKVAGSKFYFLKNDMVRLNRALIDYGIDTVTKHGYTLMETPDLAKNEILEGIGFNPRGDETQVYSVENSELSLIGTAEITVGGFHSNEVLDLSNGPKKYVALSHCYRTESGSYGRVSKGLYRVHQFTKLEMFIFCKPEDSDKLHEELLDIEKEICDGLGFPYRVIDIATADLGAPAYRKFDIEAYMTMKGDGKKQGDYGEITSTSNCTDYQARRLNIRYKKEDGINEFVHTLNGTAVALSRFPIAVLENNQNEDGSIDIPECLVKYMGKNKIN